MAKKAAPSEPQGILTLKADVLYYPFGSGTSPITQEQLNDPEVSAWIAGKLSDEEIAEMFV